MPNCQILQIYHGNVIKSKFADVELYTIALYIQGYFDTLRMEIADKGITVQCVCPGPVDTQFLRDVFRTKLSSDICVRVSLETSYFAIK